MGSHPAPLLRMLLAADDAPAAAADSATYLSPLAVGLALALLALNGLVSVWLSLGLHQKLAISTVRCVVQLTLLGTVLGPLFSYNAWWLVLLYITFMVAVASAEAVSHPPAAYKGMLVHVLSTMGVSTTAVLAYTLFLVMRPHPFWSAQYAIPTLGMLLNACISGVSVGLSTVMEELTSGRDRVELLLSLGASRWEATRALVQRCLALALTPSMNALAIAGLVAIPGMMTGQILGGTPPLQASRYQICILVLGSAATCAGTVGAVHLALVTLVDRRHRVRSEAIVSRGGRGSGVAQFVQAQAIRGGLAAFMGLRRGARRLRLVWSQRAHLFGRGRRTGRRQGQAYQGLDSMESRLRDVVVGASEDDGSEILSRGQSSMLSDAGEAQEALLEADSRRHSSSAASPMLIASSSPPPWSSRAAPADAAAMKPS